MKKISIGLMTLIMAIGFAAFTTPKSAPAKTLFNNWYEYMPGSTPDPTDPDQYVYVTTIDDCHGNDRVCVISSPGPSGTGQHPTFTKGQDPYNNTAEGVSVIAETANP